MRYASCAWSPHDRHLRLRLELARRELRGGLQGFRIFFLCLLLGTAAIAGVESLSDAFLTGLRDQGQTFLGGDVAVHWCIARPAPQEHAFLARYGRISSNISMRAMAYALRDGKQAERQLVEAESRGRSPGRCSARPASRPRRDLRDVLALRG